jgi:hypothetical protein
MTRGRFKVFTIIVFLFTAGIIGALVFLPENFFSSKNREIQKTRVVIPQSVGVGAGGESTRLIPGEDTRALKIHLEADEEAAAVLTLDFDGDSNEEQVIAYRKFQDIDSPIYITYVAFDESREMFYRQWNAATAATKPGTLILYSEDLIGDNGICILVSGMNNAGEQTLTAFRKMDSRTEPFIKIAEFLIEGSIAVEDSNYGRRPEGHSLSIATYGRDYSSANIMDQIEVTYTFNPVNSLYEQSRVVSIPGTRIEQMRVGELLNGDPKRFEGFIDGLWYQGEGAVKKYVYFNTTSRELIFYDTNSQEVYAWQNSNPTSYGIHITGSNVSLTKLRRTVNVELVSMESIRLRVFQDAYLRSGPGVAWDGAYHRLPAAETAGRSRSALPFMEGRFASQDAVIAFNRDGSYRLDPISGPSELSRHGRYALFTLENVALLELRTTKTGNGETETNGAVEKTTRETFKISHTTGDTEETITLNRIRIGTRGIQDLHEAPIVLQKSS